MSRRLSILVAVLTLIPGSFVMAAPVAAAPPDAFDDGPILVQQDAVAGPIDVLANDTVALDATITSTTDPAHGAVVIADDGRSVTYAPDGGFAGVDMFDYTVTDVDTSTATATVTIDVNAPPTAVDDSQTFLEDAAATPIFVLANDTDLESDALMVTAKTNGTKGSVAIADGGGSVTYTPNPNANGSDSFTYTVSDDRGGSTIGSVGVTITPVNDPPIAGNDGVPTPFRVYLKAGPKALPVLANDNSGVDAPETLLITGVTKASHGIVAITGGGTGLTYNPTTTGVDVFHYTISDGNDGFAQGTVQVSVITDTTRPSAAIVSIQKSPIPGRSGLRVYVHWSLSDTGSGIRSQLFQRRTDNGSWLTVSLPSVTTRSVSLALGRGHAYTFRVRATDRAGNVGAFASREIRI